MSDNGKQFNLPIRMIYIIVLICALLLFQIFVLSKLQFSAAILQYETVSFLIPGVFFTYLIHIIQKYYHTNNALNVPNISMILFFSALTLLGNYIACATVFKNDAAYINYLVIATPIKSIFTVFLYTVGLLIFWIKQQKIQESRLKKFAIEKERDGLQIELNSLEQQFKPHFLFNSLNSINALTISNPVEARKMIHLLSEFMRGSLRKNDSELIPLRDELHHIKLYSQIEKVRFGERLEVIYDVPESVLDNKLPLLILQPLIENSIKYGLYGSIDTVKIEMTVAFIDNFLTVSITNPFDETSSSGAEGTGYGLQSIEKKMMILYHQSGLLSIEKSEHQFTAILKIPQ